MEMTNGYYIAWRDPKTNEELPYLLWWNAKNNRFFKQETDGKKVKWERLEEIND